MDMDKYIGKRLDGRYELTELIGEGGMANVYKATDVLENRVVAVKILKVEFSENEEFLRRFRNESKAIALLSHPNIVKIYDVGFSEKIQYIVMEYIEGITLKDYIDSERVLNWKDAVHFIIQILRALQHAHMRGIVHRDIKPQNIMLLMDGTIKVMDFGIAKFARDESRTATDQAIGTVHYISPEQARGDVTDAKSDLYSVGVMFYEMLTGRKPFDTDNPVSIAVMHMQNAAVRPRDINPNIPSGLEEIIMHAMEKDANKRYQTAADMIRDLEAFKQNNQIVFGYYGVPKAQEVRMGRTQYRAAAPMPNRAAPVRAGAGRMQEPYPYASEQDLYYEGEEDGSPAYEETNSKSPLVPVLMAITLVVIVVAAILIVYFVKTGMTKSNQYEVPNLIGTSYQDAIAEYQGTINFKIEKQDYSDQYEADIIYEQSPIGKVDLDDNGTVTVVIAVSKGLNKVAIPDLRDKTSEEAQKELHDKGLTCRLLSEESTEGIEKNHVIRTEPAADTEIAVGGEVVIYVSAGVAVEEVEIPNFVGQQIEDAKIDCEEYKLKVETVEKDSEKEKGEILEQDLEAGSYVVEGSKITFTISSGKEPKGTITFGMDVPGLASGKYTMDFTSSDGDIIKSYTFIAESANGYITIPIEGSGTKQVIVSVTSANSGATTKMGTYNFLFADGTFTVTSENIDAAFEAVTIQNTQPQTQPQQSSDDAASE